MLGVGLGQHALDELVDCRQFLRPCFGLRQCRACALCGQRAHGGGGDECKEHHARSHAEGTVAAHEAAGAICQRWCARQHRAMVEQALQVISELAGSGVALCRVAGQRFHHHLVQITACGRGEVVQARRIFALHDIQCFEQRGMGQARVRQAATDQFIGNHAERIDIAAGIHVAAASG